MAEKDNMQKAYALADQWISVVLSTSPELLVEKVVATTHKNQQPVLDFDGVVRRAQALAEFRQQLGNALSAQYFPPDLY